MTTNTATTTRRTFAEVMLFAVEHGDTETQAWAQDMVRRQAADLMRRLNQLTRAGQDVDEAFETARREGNQAGRQRLGCDGFGDAMVAGVRAALATPEVQARMVEVVGLAR